MRTRSGGSGVFRVFARIDRAVRIHGQSLCILAESICTSAYHMWLRRFWFMMNLLWLTLLAPSHFEFLRFDLLRSAFVECVDLFVHYKDLIEFFNVLKSGSTTPCGHEVIQKRIWPNSLGGSLGNHVRRPMRMSSCPITLKLLQQLSYI